MVENATQPQLALSAYNNQALFSDHYLQDILRRQPQPRHPGRRPGMGRRGRFQGVCQAATQKTTRLSDLLTVYRQHAPAVAALSARLAATDDLIDQVIYKLYGLTDAEIAIVEGSS